MNNMYTWNPEKNNLIKELRGLSFEEIVLAIDQGGVVDILHHPNKQKYDGQLIMYVRLDDYVCAVPCKEIDDGEIYLITAFYDRKATRKYLKGEGDE